MYNSRQFTDNETKLFSTLKSTLLSIETVADKEIVDSRALSIFNTKIDEACLWLGAAIAEGLNNSNNSNNQSPANQA